MFFIKFWNGFSENFKMFFFFNLCVYVKEKNFVVNVGRGRLLVLLS